MKFYNLYASQNLFRSVCFMFCTRDIKVYLFLFVCVKVLTILCGLAKLKLAINFDKINYL